MIWVHVINKNIKWHTSHITGSYVLESDIRRQQSLYAHWPVKSVHDHDDGGSARSKQFVAGKPGICVLKWS